MPFSFEVSAEELLARLEQFVEDIMESLDSEFLVMPRGPGFVEYQRFSDAYEALRGATKDFTACSGASLGKAIDQDNLAVVVLRSILGFTPSEWAHVASKSSAVKVDQGFCRSLDRKVRLDARNPALSETPRVVALLSVASTLLSEGPREVGAAAIHRLDKADTRDGWTSVRHMAALGAPYAMLLYERFLGRPFAGHRDSVSELVGGGLEAAIERRLEEASIPYRKTKRAARVPGFDQAPDFIIPDEFNPRVVIEAKLTEDDGTARDKVTRVQHLAQLARGERSEKLPKFQVVAVIAGRGFAVRREDMRKLLIATNGKVYTLKTLDRLVETSDLVRFVV